MNNSKELFSYHIFPPNIDAYISSYSATGETLVDLESIRDMMIGHSIEWGEQSIGSQILENKVLSRFDDKLVVCCAYVENETTKEKFNYLMVIDNELEGNYWFDKLNLVQGEILDSWDLT